MSSNFFPRLIQLFDGVVNQLYVLHAILLLVALLVVFLGRSRNRFLIVSVIAFMFLWRTPFRITSSRYFCAIICIFFALVSFAYRQLSIRHDLPFLRHLFLLLLFVLIGSNIIILLSSYSNVFILDAAEDIDRTLGLGNSDRVYIHEKEIRRIGNNNRRCFTFFSNNKETVFDDFIRNHFITKRSFLAIFRRASVFENIFLKNNLRFQAVRKYNANKDKTNYFVVYSVEPQSPPLSGQASSTSQKNLIVNGSVDSIQSKNSVKKRLSLWIDQGASFYDSDDILLPSYEILIPVWDSINPEKYPLVFADSEDPISGKYSLHITSEGDTLFAFHLFNRIQSVPGTFSFRIKNLKDCSILSVRRNDYPDKVSNQSYCPSSSIYHFSLNDNLVHEITQHVSENDLHGKYSLFSLSGVDFDILIDDVSFIPD